MFTNMRLGLKFPWANYMQSGGANEGFVCRGDWVYILNTQRTNFNDRVSLSGLGAAGAGWNLICTHLDAPTKLYMDFGLNEPGLFQAKSLEQITVSMAKSTTKEDKQTRHKRSGSGDFGMGKGDSIERAMAIDIKINFVRRFDPVKIVQRAVNALQI